MWGDIVAVYCPQGPSDGCPPAGSPWNISNPLRAKSLSFLTTAFGFQIPQRLQGIQLARQE